MPSTVTLVYAKASSASLDAVAEGIMQALRDSGTALSVMQFESDSAYAVDDLRQFVEIHRPLGVVFFAPQTDDPALPAVCREAGCNYVRIAPNAIEEAPHLVCSNDRQGAMDAVQYLIVLGHQRIGFIAGPENWHSARERELGYMDALAAEGLDLGAGLVSQGDGSFASGCDAGRLLLEVSPRPTAVFAACDEMALGMLVIAQQAGIKVPHELSVIGFGDNPAAAMSNPTLTTMRLPLTEMAFAGTMKLLDPEHARAQPVEYFCELTTRGSTASPS